MPRQARASRSLSFGVQAIVGAIAVGALGSGVVRSLHVTSEISDPSRRAVSQAVIEQEACLREQLRERVPKGASVYLDGSVFDRLLLGQFVAGWAVPTDSATTSSMTITLATDAAGGCLGAEIKASPP
jgi:hypothetical protein